MTSLLQKALASLPLSRETVEDFYTGKRSGTAEQCLKVLCESHENLRMHLQATGILLEASKREVETLKRRLAERDASAKVLPEVDRRKTIEEFHARKKGVGE
ncbi:MAG: hypothetical protein KGL39_26910 [Patescibacteria group bacterium]|nr:hypothetical protein [Patescibacteria group bacterium]